MSAESNEELDRLDMAQLAAGQDASLNLLMERHGPKLFHYLIRVLQDEAEASDLAQETFVRVYQHRARFNSGQKFSTWLYAIATNLARDRLRWRARHPQVSLDAEHEETGGNMADTLKSPVSARRKPCKRRNAQSPCAMLSRRCRKRCACRWSWPNTRAAPKRRSPRF